MCTSSRVCPLRCISFAGPRLVLVFVPAHADVWSEAARQIVRLQPSSFARLPTEVVRELNARGCTVPQTQSAAQRDQRILR